MRLNGRKPVSLLGKRVALSGNDISSLMVESGFFNLDFYILSNIRI